MNRGDAMELCCALREIAESLERLLAHPTEDLAETATMPQSEEMERALMELLRGLVQLQGLAVPAIFSEAEGRTLLALGRSHGHKTASGVLRYLVASVCDGVRRPGSWERGCVEMLFGGDAIREAEGS